MRRRRVLPRAPRVAMPDGPRHSIVLLMVAGYLSVLLLLGAAWAVVALDTQSLHIRFSHMVQVDDALATNVALRAKLMDDQETGLRGYLLTRSSAFLEPYAHGRQALPAVRAQGDALAAGEPGVSPLLAAMLRRALAWERWAGRTLAAPSTDVAGSPDLVARQVQGKALFDRFRAASDAVAGYLDARRRRGLRANGDTEALMNGLLAATFLAGLVLVALAGWLSTRAVTRPLARLRRAAAAIGRGDLAQPVAATGAHEFALLAHSMDQMRRQLHSQHRLAAIIGSTLHLDDIYAQFAAGIRELVPFERLSLSVADGEGATLVTAYATGFATDSIVTGTRRARAESVAGLAYRTGTPVVRHDLAALRPGERFADEQIVLEAGIRSLAIVPLLSKGQVAGTLNLGSTRPGTYTQEILGPILALAPLVAAAVDNAHLYRTIDQANRELERANRVKSAFLANMSHELRTPLNAIIGFSEVLQDGAFGSLNERQQRYVGNVLESGRHLLSLVNDILDISKVEAGRMELYREDLDLAALLAEVRDTMLPLARAREVGLRVGVDDEAPLIHIHADRTRVVQIAYNLLSNALKFTPPGGTVSVSWVAQPDTVAIAVTDTGIGIAPEDQARIFEEFQQVDSSLGRAQQGTGLGLALTRRLVELHGGTIDLESVPGQGSTFTVTLPRAQPALPMPGRYGDVLVVEDNPTARELLGVYLTEAGYGVQWAERVEDIVPRVRESQPVAITLDILMRDEVAWPALAQLKADARTRDIPVVIVSIVDDQPTGFALGASAYLVKPVARQELLDALHRIINAQPAPGRTPRVLVVDDQPEALELTALALEGSPFQVLRATSGAEALGLLTRERPDALLLDLTMAPLSGFDVIDAVATDPRTNGIPMIVLTARNLTAEDIARLNGHVAAIMSKSSFTKEYLVRELRRATLRGQTGESPHAR